ncbi:type IV secretory system conjugative DNA transfer family protein [uncultured Roseobacter sp.]|uniref:type IV secretory system conjugative DNA transfer family protein n=1 Tax=uncultured Roseobacter sp. TaxID=114847 RepID=UPI002627E1D2|nr:type IV secretory system conjugative DNA transfer family protein [uncultured Roseobacter sp.]
MARPFENAAYPFGSSHLAEEAELEASGMFEWTPGSIYCGKAYGRRLWVDFVGGYVLTAGARSGKLRDVLAYNICSGVLPNETLLIFDIKGELAVISQDQTPDRKFCIYWNPHGLHGMPQHKINLASHIRWSSPTLISDIKELLDGLLPQSGAPQAKFFELNAARIAEALCVILTKTNGVLTLPDLYHAVLLLKAGGDRWLDFAYQMHISGIAECISVEAEIHDAKKADSRSFNDIIGELQAALGALSDDLLCESLSGPFDFGMEDLCKTGQAYQLYLICPEAMVKPWSAIVKAILASAKTLKGRAPDAPRQTWVIDEAGRLFGYEQIVRLFTDGAGVGCRPLVIFQDFLQANQLMKDGAQLIASSAAVQIFFGVRDDVTAQRVSNLLGFETLEYDEPLVQSRAQTQRTSLLSSLFSGGDPLKIAVKLAGIAYEMRHKVKVKRAIRTPDEVRYGPDDALYLFADGLSGGVIGSRGPYWEDPMMAGRFLPSPYHPPYDKVRVTTRWGKSWRRVITEPVPDEYAHYPQYRSGTWAYVEGRSQ